MKPQKDENWYVRLPGDSTLTKKEILDITSKIVTFKDFRGCCDGIEMYGRVTYKRSDIELVELVHQD